MKKLRCVRVFDPNSVPFPSPKITLPKVEFAKFSYVYENFSIPLDKMEKSGYNGVRYKETYGYDSFKEYLETLTAYENDTQKAQNTMVYDEGELSNSIQQNLGVIWAQEINKRWNPLR